TEVGGRCRAQEGGGESGLHADADLPPVDADIGRIRQILHNLIRNSIEALDASRDGRVDVTVRAAEYQGIAVVEVLVEDNGPGFQPGYLGQIFDPYVTTKPRGTGLGLAIVKKLVEEHAG